VTDLCRPQDRLTTGPRKEAQKAERFSGLICALLAQVITKGTKMTTKGTRRFIVRSYFVNQCSFVVFFVPLVIEGSDAHL